MSGYTGDTAVRHGLLERGEAFLEKPFGPAALGRKMREVLDGLVDSRTAGESTPGGPDAVRRFATAVPATPDGPIAADVPATTDDVASDTTDEVTEGTTDAVPAGTSDDVTEDTTDAVPAGTSDDVTEDTTDEVTEASAGGATDDATDGTTDGTTHEVAPVLDEPTADDWAAAERSATGRDTTAG